MNMNPEDELTIKNPPIEDILHPLISKPTINSEDKPSILLSHNKDDPQPKPNPLQLSDDPYIEEEHQPKPIPKDSYPKNPIERYNFFVKHYNKEHNQAEPGIKLNEIKVNFLYSSSYSIINHKWWRLIAIVVILVVPIVNVALSVSIFYSWHLYKRALETYKKDREKVKRPFAKMVYAPELCQNEGKICVEKEIELSGLKKFHFNPEILKDLQGRQLNENREVRFMAYSNKFWKFYYDFPRYSDYHVWWSIFAFVYLLLGCFLEIIYIVSLSL